MSYKIALPVIIGFVLATAGTHVLAQDPADTVEVGIVEHLDKTVPDGLSFRDENNKPVILKEIIKRPTILALIYFDCPGICPQLLAGISNVVKKLDMQLGKDYQIVAVSFNPLDTPDKALDKKNNFLDNKSRPFRQYWNYLTGDSANIYSLTNAVGFKFIHAGNDFIHPVCITILSPDGKITRYLYGTVYLPFDVKMALIEAQKGIYSLAVTKVSATIIIFIAVVFFISLLIRSSRKKSRSKETSNPSNS
jgi:protein SCO1